MRLQLALNLHRHIDRDGEREAHETARLAVDLRIDADHLALQVEQWPAGVARVDRHVGLDEGNEVFLGQRTPLGAHDAGSDGVLEAEGRTDGEHPVTHPQLARVAQADLGQAGRLDLEQGHIRARIGAHQAGTKLPLVAQLDDDLVGPSTTWALVST
jgi:hypothetical protein